MINSDSDGARARAYTARLTQIVDTNTAWLDTPLLSDSFVHGRWVA